MNQVTVMTNTPLSNRSLRRLAVMLGFVVLVGILHVQIAVAQGTPALSAIDRTRLAETFGLAERVEDRIWPNWSKAPFAVLLVTPEYEFLIRHPKPSSDFTSLGYDSVLKSNVYYRRRTYPPHFLATFPAVGGISTIVVGQAENTTAKTSTPWVVTLLHEHFHQLQDSQPNFYADVNALNLSHGDQTGMWMLNYAFPYERDDVQKQFERMSLALAAALTSPRPGRGSNVEAYLQARRKFQELVSADDNKYWEFQLWKEGIARYTEYQSAHLAAAAYRPSKEFRALQDYRLYREVARELRDGIMRQLQTQKLAESKREVVYSFGAAEGLLLDQISPHWKQKYFVKKFDLKGNYPARY